MTARLANGERVTGSLLIGADGLWSNIRKQVVADGPPRVSGHTTYRSVIPTEQMPEDLRWNAATLWAGPKCHIVHYPLSGWKVFNLVVTYHNDAPEPVAGKPVSDEEVHAGFWPRACSARRTSSATARTGGCGCCATAIRVERWVDGRVALLGDAAHPMLQYFAQGACQAMEDAVCLSHMLAQHDDHATALEAYRAQRFPAHRAGAVDVPRHRRAHLSPRRRTRPAAQRHHGREDVGGVVRRSGVALWRDGAGGIASVTAPSSRATCARDP